MGITMEQASENVGRRVTYASQAMREKRHAKEPEAGVIERVGREYVFVRYVGGKVAATRAEDLEFELAALDDDDRQDKMIDAREALRSMDEGTE